MGPSQQTSDLSVDVEGFANEMQFADLGLVFVGARVYDPVLGRLLSADPVSLGVSSQVEASHLDLSPERRRPCD
jgi:RHS repeat-associated protein